jgi:hypothetical protein
VNEVEKLKAMIAWLEADIALSEQAHKNSVASLMKGLEAVRWLRAREKEERDRLKQELNQLKGST